MLLAAASLAALDWIGILGFIVAALTFYLNQEKDRKTEAKEQKKEILESLDDLESQIRDRLKKLEAAQEEMQEAIAEINTQLAVLGATKKLRII